MDYWYLAAAIIALLSGAGVAYAIKTDSSENYESLLYAFISVIGLVAAILIAAGRFSYFLLM